MSGLARDLRPNSVATGSEVLTQARQKLQASIAIGGLHADLALKVADREHGVVADPAIGATGVETERGEALLDFLHLGERGRALLGAREGLDERSAAADAIAESIALLSALRRAPARASATIALRLSLS